MHQRVRHGRPLHSGTCLVDDHNAWEGEPEVIAHPSVEGDMHAGMVCLCVQLIYHLNGSTAYLCCINIVDLTVQPLANSESSQPRCRTNRLCNAVPHQVAPG